MAKLMVSIVGQVVEKIGVFSTVEQIEILTCVIKSLQAIRSTLIVLNAHWRESWDEEGEEDAQD